MKLSIFHGIAAMGIGFALIGMVDDWIARTFGFLLLVAGSCVTWAYRAQFREDRPDE